MSVNQISIDSDNVSSHYLNQFCVIVNWTLENQFQWNFIQNAKLFIYKYASENIVCEMAAILSRGRWDNAYMHWWIGSLLVRCQATSWANADSFSTGTLSTNFIETWTRKQTLSFQEIHIWKCHQQNVDHFVQWSCKIWTKIWILSFKIWCSKFRPFFPSINELTLH